MRSGNDARITLALWVSAFLHASFTGYFALKRLHTYKASLLDVGVFDQVLWNLTQHGAPLTTATLPFTSQHWLGFHFSPLLFALAPLYALWPGPDMLQLVQSFCFALAGIPLFYAARTMRLRPIEAFLCALLYWLNPFVLSACLWDFHEICLSTLLLSLAVWAFIRSRFLLLTGILFLLLLTKEHYGLAVAGFGFLWGWRYSEWKRGGLLMGMGVLGLLLVIKLFMPFFHGGEHSMLASSGSVVDRYGWLSGTWSEKLATLHGLLLGDGSSQITGVMHLLLLLLSGVLLPLFATLYLAPATADILANLLSTNPMQRHQASYHAAACIPVILMAAMQGYRWLCLRKPQARNLISVTALSLSLVFPMTGLTLFSLNVWELVPGSQPDARKAFTEITSLLGKAPVSAQANIGMFFSQREEIYPFPHQIGKAEFVVLHLFSPFTDPYQQHFNIPFATDARVFFDNVRAFMNLPDWHIAYWQAPWLVMKRGAEERNEANDRAEINAAIASMTFSQDRWEK